MTVPQDRASIDAGAVWAAELGARAALSARLRADRKTARETARASAGRRWWHR